MHQTLYLDTPGTVLRRDAGALVIERNDRAVGRVPLHRLGRILLWGGTHITTPALRMVAEAGVDVALLSERGLIGTLRGPTSGSLVGLLAQVATFHDPARCLERAHELVVAKIGGQRDLVRGAWWRGDTDRRAALLERLALDVQAGDLDTLRGLEGHAARAYFEALASIVQPPFEFTGRNRRPPRDPVNALLSLGYMLLVTEIQADIEARGLDPRIGFLHAVRPGRPALALDLMEPWRAPVVDRLVLTVLNRGMLKPSDFEGQADGGVKLSGPAFARFINAWETHLGSREPPECDAPPGLRRRMAAWLDGFEARLMGMAGEDGASAGLSADPLPGSGAAS